MAQDVAAVEQALLALAPDQRAAVIRAGLLSLEDTSPTPEGGIDEAWIAELRRRVDDVESGRVELVSHDETVSQARAELAARRP